MRWNAARGVELDAEPEVIDETASPESEESAPAGRQVRHLRVVK